MTKGVYSFFQYYGRFGSLEGIFVEDEEKVESLYGKQVYSGELLGKHSDVVCDISRDNLTLVTNDPSAVEVLERYNINVGYNPFDYVD